MGYTAELRDQIKFGVQKYKFMLICLSNSYKSIIQIEKTRFKRDEWSV